MTISYQRDVASSTAGGFTRLLFKWKGSLYKLIYRELLLFMCAFILLSTTYRCILTDHQKGIFKLVVKYFDAFLNWIPLTFILGFYVSFVAARWWQQFLAIPWPDKLFHSVACFVDGFDEESRILRRSLMRYMNLALILVLRSISSAVKQRFPTLGHVVEAGFMTQQEKDLFEAVPCNEFNTYWIPCTWFVYRIQEAAKKGKLVNAYALETIMREFCEFRAKCGLLWCYDWVSIPMVYTQVVTLATYVFFIFTIIGRQNVGHDETVGGRKPQEFMRSGRMIQDIDLYIPVYTILQFLFYMGLLKVAEQLINPFGDDDEDFELNWMVDRHMKASFLGCDILMDPDRIPPIVKDYYWDKQNCPIPYTEASMHFKRKTYKGSADDMIIPESKQHMVLPEIEEGDEDLNQRHSKLSLTSLLLESSNLVANIGIGNNLASIEPRNSTTAQEKGNNIVPDAGTNGVLPHPPTSANVYETSPTALPPSQGTRAFHGQFGPNWRHSTGSNPSTPQSIYPPSGTSRQTDEAVSASSSSNLSHLQAPSMSAALLRRGSDSSLPNFWGKSIDSATDEEDLAARRDSSSATMDTERRGSRLMEFLEKRNKKADRKRYKDKQGFVWRRMTHDNEDLLAPRAPSLGQGATPWLTTTSDGSSSMSSTPMPSTPFPPTPMPSTPFPPTPFPPTPMPSLAPIDHPHHKISISSNKSDMSQLDQQPPVVKLQNSFSADPKDMPPPLAPINNSSLDMQHKISTVSSASSNKSRDSSLNKSEPVAGVVPKTKPKHPLQSKNSFRADPPPVPKQVLVSDPIAMPKPIVQARSSIAGKSPQAAAASSQPQQPSAAAVTSASPTRSSSISSPPPTENNLTTGGTVRHLVRDR